MPPTLKKWGSVFVSACRMYVCMYVCVCVGGGGIEISSWNIHLWIPHGKIAEA